MEEALVEMYLAGVSVRRVEDITEALWGTRVSPSTVSELNQRIYAQIEAWRNQPIETGWSPGSKRCCITTRFRATTGGACGRIIRWNGCYARCGEGREK